MNDDNGTTAAANNARVISALLERFLVLGVRECCVAAGARNAGIIAALHQMTPRMTLRHFFEERSAAFFALGRIMADRQPVAVVTTSGTAVAELLPAVIEAHYQALPLVAVTADRPRHYAGSGAPQAIEQEGIFGCYVSESHELASDRIVDRHHAGPGPVHINVRLEEGMPHLPVPVAGNAFVPPFDPPSDTRDILDRHEWDEFWAGKGPVVVLIGGLHPADAAEVAPLLQRLDLPIVAEATANLPTRPGWQPRLLCGGEAALKAGGFTRVLRIGAVPSWRWWRDLEDRPDIRVLNVARAPFPGLARSAGVASVSWEVLHRERPASLFDTQLPAAEAQLSSKTIAAKLARLLDLYPDSEPAWMRRLSRLIPTGVTVFLGNSLPIREWNFAADASKDGTVFFANRGANGIDGLVSTWLGISANSAESWCIVGDLSALYDLSAPWILSQLPLSNRRLVVINNGGGKIFSRVGWLASLPEEIRQVIENQHALNFESWAQMWKLKYQLFTDSARDTARLAGSVDAPSCKTEIWEIRPDAEQTEGFWREWSV